ncbi:MAG: DUF1064 domain-containing protein [Burkholderiaceae bacterium]
MNKYRNKPVTIGGEKYRSQREADRHRNLTLLQTAGEIAGLTREVPFVLAPGVKFERDKRAKPALRYVADFVYTTKFGQTVVEDCKGVRTQVYRIKRHLMKVTHGIEVFET